MKNYKKILNKDWIWNDHQPVEYKPILPTELEKMYDHVAPALFLAHATTMLPLDVIECMKSEIAMLKKSLIKGYYIFGQVNFLVFVQQPNLRCQVKHMTVFTHTVRIGVPYCSPKVRGYLETIDDWQDVPLFVGAMEVKSSWHEQDEQIIKAAARLIEGFYISIKESVTPWVEHYRNAANPIEPFEP